MPQLLIPQGAYYITGYYTAYNMNICNNDDEPVCHLIKKKKTKHIAQVPVPRYNM